MSAPAGARTFSAPTYSSPIALSADGKLVWVVNPGADSVSVIRTSTNSVIKKITVGDEPQSVALDPNNKYAFVANAAASTVTPIKITNPNPRHFRARATRALTTGAEPWNVVSSPDGRRVFVANSTQDTITVIDAQTHKVRRRVGRRLRTRLIPPHIIGNVNVGNSLCNNPDRSRLFQPRGLAVTQDSRKLYVTSLFAFTRPGGRQGDDDGKQGAVCRLNIKTRSTKIRDYRPAQRIVLGAQVAGFTVDNNGDGTPDPLSAFPNQLQSIVIRGNQAYLPNIAASPAGPQRFDTSTMAYVNVIDGVRGSNQFDASAGKFLNLHLGARDPEAGKKKLFFANPWAIAFTNQRGGGRAYVVSAGSDLLVKVNVDGAGKLGFTVDQDTTRYIDLNDPNNPATSGDNAGKNPQGIVINRAGTRAWVQNFVSGNVSVVDLNSDSVIKVIRTVPLPPPGSQAEVVKVGAEMFFSSRGAFDRPAGATVSTNERLSNNGWQSCSSCHFKGLTDAVVWEFGSGPRRSTPLNATFNPNDPNDQRILNYSAIMDEVEDFEANIRNVSGPGALATAQPCDTPPPATSTFDPNHGLLTGDSGNINLAPCAINTFAKPNANRAQLTVTLPGSGTHVPALTALREWVRFAVRTPNGPVTTPKVKGGVSPSRISQGRTLFEQAGCTSCHLGGKWTLSRKDFTSPPAATEISTETNPAPDPAIGKPTGVASLNRFLRDIGSFNKGVPGKGNDIGNDVGADEKATAAVVNGVAQPAPDGLGIDYNHDGKGIGFNVPSLLGIGALPPYYHNGACETLGCVVGDVKHRTANGTQPDRLSDPAQQGLVVTFLRSINARTAPPG